MSQRIKGEFDYCTLLVLLVHVPRDVGNIILMFAQHKGKNWVFGTPAIITFTQSTMYKMPLQYKFIDSLLEGTPMSYTLTIN